MFIQRMNSHPEKEDKLASVQKRRANNYVIITMYNIVCKKYDKKL